MLKISDFQNYLHQCAFLYEVSRICPGADLEGDRETLPEIRAEFKHGKAVITSRQKVIWRGAEERLFTILLNTPDGSSSGEDLIEALLHSPQEI